jgi:hypothetical protein
MASCFARDLDGTTLSCASYDANIVSVAQSLQGDGHVRFYANEFGGCTSITVRSSSYTRAKAH